MQPRLLTVKEACKILGLGGTTVNHLIQSGELRSFLIGQARRIPTEAIDEYLAGLQAEHAAERVAS